MKERIKELLRGRSIRSAAEDWGLPFSTVRNWLSRGSIPPLDTAAKVAKAEGVSLDWLAGNSGEPNRACAGSVEPKASVVLLSQEEPTRTARIPMYEVEAAAGAGSWINGENVTDYWYVPQSWLRQERLEHADLCIINTIGDSMAPTFSSGDKLLVKLNINRDKGLEGVFAINLDGHLRVKRLEVSMFPHGYRVMSDNELYPEEFVPAAEFTDRLYVVGEVVRVFGAPASRPASRPANQPEDQPLVSPPGSHPSVSEKGRPGTDR